MRETAPASPSPYTGNLDSREKRAINPNFSTAARYAVDSISRISLVHVLVCHATISHTRNTDREQPAQVGNVLLISVSACSVKGVLYPLDISPARLSFTCVRRRWTQRPLTCLLCVAEMCYIYYYLLLFPLTARFLGPVVTTVVDTRPRKQNRPTTE